MNSFDRGNVENIAIAATVNVPKSTPPTGASANGSQSPFGASSSQAPPNAFPRRVAYQFTSARDHVQSVGTYGLGHHLEISKMDVVSVRRGPVRHCSLWRSLQRLLLVERADPPLPQHSRAAAAAAQSQAPAARHDLLHHRADLPKYVLGISQHFFFEHLAKHAYVTV